MRIKNSREKPTDITESKESAENFDLLPTLSKYDESKDLLDRAIFMLPIIWSFVSKIGKSSNIQESGVFARIISKEAVFTGLLFWLSTNGYLTTFAFQILLLTLYSTLIIACGIFVSLLVIEGIEVVYKKIKSVNESDKKKRKAKQPKKTLK